MSAVLQRPAIKFLPPQLADQIAAGEVIERPASVLKELIENALDAHASRIDIELSAGGMEHIRVTDNGEGIPCDELPLAISRHATSKLSSIYDLLALQTLGFRGEALASICSVSQWQLISCTNQNPQACKLTNAQVTQPIADQHPRGTTVQIDKLFHNTPARRKFLRAERTEFRHCDDVIRRMALARFDVGFFVKHNARQVHRLPAVMNDHARSRRVAQLCGESFVQESLLIDYSHEGMRVWGWISRPGYSRQQTDLQYFYINGRIVRDRMLNHAIRLAYQDRLPSGRQAAYVLYLEIEPDRFDVNVHPTKQEVRFRETRMVHDFLSRSLRQALSSDPVQPDVQNDSGWVRETLTGYHYTAQTDAWRALPAQVTSANLAEPQQGVWFDRFVFTKLGEQTLLVDLPSAYAQWAAGHWYQQYQSGKVTTQPILIPERLSLDDATTVLLEQHADVLLALGLDISLLSRDQAMLRFIPGWLVDYAHAQLLTSLLHAIKTQVSESVLREALLGCQLDVTRLDSKLLLRAIAATPDAFADCWREIQATDLASFFP